MDWNKLLIGVVGLLLTGATNTYMSPASAAGEIQTSRLPGDGLVLTVAEDDERPSNEEGGARASTSEQPREAAAATAAASSPEKAGSVKSRKHSAKAMKRAPNAASERSQ